MCYIIYILCAALICYLLYRNVGAIEYFQNSIICVLASLSFFLSLRSIVFSGYIGRTIVNLSSCSILVYTIHYPILSLLYMKTDLFVHTDFSFLAWAGLLLLWFFISYSLLNTISGLLFPIVTFPYVARILMADGIGQVNFYLSIINYISMFAGLGIPTYAIREIARVKSNVKEMNQVAVEILLLHTFLTLLGYIVVGVVALTVAQVQVNLPLFLILSMNLFFIAIGCEWFYQGMEDFKYITIRGLIVKMLSVALLFVLVKDRSDLLYYGVYSVVGVVGGNIFNAFRLRKYIKFHLLELKELHPMRHLIPALRIFLLNVVASIYLQLDTVMLGFLKGNEAVGYYTGAIKLTKMLMGITSSLCVVLLPRLSNLVVENEREEFERLLRKALDYVITIAAPMSMGLVIMAPTLVYLFCGEGYVPSISTMQITAPIILFISISYVLVQSIFSLGKENITIITGIVGALTNVAINFMLIPHWAQDGAAIGTLLAEFSVMIAYLFIIRRFSIISIFTRHTALCLFAVAIMGTCLWGVSLWKFSHTLNLFVMPLVGGAVYATVLGFAKEPLLLDVCRMVKQRIRIK